MRARNVLLFNLSDPPEGEALERFKEIPKLTGMPVVIAAWPDRVQRVPSGLTPRAGEPQRAVYLRGRRRKRLRRKPWGSFPVYASTQQ